MKPLLISASNVSTLRTKILLPEIVVVPDKTSKALSSSWLCHIETFSISLADVSRYSHHECPTSARAHRPVLGDIKSVRTRHDEGVSLCSSTCVVNHQTKSLLSSCCSLIRSNARQSFASWFKAVAHCSSLCSALAKSQ